MEGRLSEKEVDRLVEQSQAGSKKAFEKLYHAYVRALYKYVYFKVHEDDVEDIVETVFIKVWENLGKYKKRDTTFGAWLFRIAHNLVVDHYRTHRAIEPIDSLMIEDTNRLNRPEVLAENALSNVALKGAIFKLNDKYKQVVVLKHVNGLTYEEIAKITGRTESNVRLLNFRALAELKKILTNSGFTA